MGSRTEPAAVHIAHVLQRLHFFQFFNFFNNLHDFPQKKITRIYRKKITRLAGFFVHLHFSLLGMTAIGGLCLNGGVVHK